MAMRTEDQWAAYAKTHVSAGFLPGGDSNNLYPSGLRMARFLLDRQIVNPGERVLDVGCGNGRLAMGLQALDLDVTYTGVEIIPQCVEFAKRAFADDARFTFKHLDVYNRRYYPLAMTMPEVATLPFVDNDFNVVICWSLFSHTETVAVAKRYLSEIQRVLQPGGRCFSTWLVTTAHDQVSRTAKRTVHLLQIAIELWSRLGNYQLLNLFEDSYAPNQIGVLIDEIRAE